MDTNFVYANVIARFLGGRTPYKKHNASPILAGSYTSYNFRGESLPSFLWVGVRVVRADSKAGVEPENAFFC